MRGSLVAILLWTGAAHAQVPCDRDLTLRRSAVAQLADYWRRVELDEARMRPFRKAADLTGTLVFAASFDSGASCFPDQDQATRSTRTFSFRGGIKEADFRLLYGNNELTFGRADKGDPSYAYHAVGGQVAIAQTVRLGAIGLFQGSKDGDGDVGGWIFSAGAPYTAVEVTVGSGDLDRATLTVGPFPAGWANVSPVVDRVHVLDVTAVGAAVEATPSAQLRLTAEAAVEVETGRPRRVAVGAGYGWIWGKPEKGAWRLDLTGEAGLFAGTHVIDYDGVLPITGAGIDLSYHHPTLIAGVGVTHSLVPERIDRRPDELAHQTLLEIHLSATGG